MKIEAENFKLELNPDELWTLGFAVKNYLLYTLKNHYVHHQDKWKENERHHLNIIKGIFNSLGRLDVYESIELEAEEIFKKYNENTSTKSN